MIAYQFTARFRFLLTFVLWITLLSHNAHECTPVEIEEVENNEHPGYCNYRSVIYNVLREVWKYRNVPLFDIFIRIYFDTYVSNPSFYEKRIVSAREVNISQYPYQVALTYNDEFICGGSIISVEYVLTAAHCVPHPRQQGKYIVRVGSNEHGRGGVVHDVSWKAKHPRYRVRDFDVGLIRVAKPFHFGELVQPVALTSQGSPLPVGAYAVITGWGKTEELSPPSNTLRMIQVPIQTERFCQHAYNGEFTQRMFCAGYQKGGQSICTGDSGSALVVGKEQVGIVSWAKGCGYPGCPTVYTKVSEMRSWITEMTGL